MIYDTSHLKEQKTNVESIFVHLYSKYHLRVKTVEIVVSLLLFVLNKLNQHEFVHISLNKED